MTPLESEICEKMSEGEQTVESLFNVSWLCRSEAENLKNQHRSLQNAKYILSTCPNSAPVCLTEETT